jgi:hypothetical protein
VLRELLALGVHAAEVHDPLHAGRRGGVGERLRHATLGLDPVAARADRVQQVVEDVDALHRPPDVVVGGGVARHDLDAVGPLVRLGLLGAADEDADVVVRVEQLGHEAAADVAGRTGDEREGHASIVGVAGARGIPSRRAGQPARCSCSTSS